MKRKFTLIISVIVILNLVQPAYSGVRQDLSRPSQAIRIIEGWVPRVSVPVIMGNPDTANAQRQIFCSDIYDETCTKSPGIFAISQLPPCDSTIKINCINSVYAVSESNERIYGKFIKLVPESGSRDFLAIEKNTPRVVIGKDAKTMDFLSRLNPLFAAKLIYKQMASLLK